jgi:hypothetical protein
VPKQLREHVGKTELRMPLGSDRRLALQQAPRALALMRDVLVRARKAAGVTRVPLTLIHVNELAALHYQEELARDDHARNRPQTVIRSTVADVNGEFGAYRAKVLEKIIGGRACDEEIRASVG